MNDYNNGDMIAVTNDQRPSLPNTMHYTFIEW